jgi:hypothetical protein
MITISWSNLFSSIIPDATPTLQLPPPLADAMVPATDKTFEDELADDDKISKDELEPPHWGPV